MPRSSSTSRSEVRRRDRHKVYAVADCQHEGRDGVFPAPTAIEEGLKSDCSSRAARLSRGDGERCDPKAAAIGGGGGTRVDNRNSSHGESAAPAGIVAATNLGSVGPGAEPPVAVASHAFAHEEPQTEAFESNQANRSKSREQDKDGAEPSFPGDERMGVSSSEEGIDKRGRVGRGDTTEHNRGCHSGKDDVAGSRPGSTNTNEEEAETLPDSFNLSDEYGLEGASTGRNLRDDEDGYDDNAEEPAFFGLDVEPTSSGNREKRDRGQGRPAAGRYSRTRRDDGDSSSEYEPRQEKRGGRVYASASDSDGWPSSSQERQGYHRGTSPPPQLWFGRRTRHNSRHPLLTAPKRSSRIVPVEAPGERRAGEGEGTRRHRRGCSRNGAQYRSPPPRRRPRGVEDDDHSRRSHRGASGCRSAHSRRLAQSETEFMAEEGNRGFEAEVARLRRENEALKQQQERSTRLSDGDFEAEPWKFRQDPDDRHLSKRSPQHASRRHNPTVRNTRHRKRFTRKSDASGVQERPREHSLDRASNPVDVEIPSTRSSSRRRQDGWSDFVSRNKPSPRRPGPAAWGAYTMESPAEQVDLGLPRVLVEGGFLWKLPYHNAGTPKRRWFQVKPADGLLTTPSGRLVVRPTVAGGGGAAGWDGCSAHSERGDDGGSGKEPVTTLPMMRVRAAWPLAFIWVDPDKDLKRSPPREMCIEEIVDLARGHKTPAFWQQAAHRGIRALPDPKLCFSLVGHDRTLDLAAETLSEAKEWVRALARVTVMIKRGGIKTSTSDPAKAFSRPPVEPVAYSDMEDLRAAKTAEDDDAGTLCQPGVYRQRPGEAATPQYDLSVRPEVGSTPKHTPLLGEGGAWSVDTIRAWRRRLFPAVSRGDVPAVLALFDQGCPVDLVQTGTGDTPMLLACRLGDIEMTRECLRRGSCNDPHPAFGQTALHAAVASGQEACARLLLETAAPSRSDAVISNHKDPNKETPLHVACRGGYSGIVDALLHHGADMRAVDKRGNTPLHGAAGGGQAHALASLLDAGGDGVLEEKNAKGERALHAAAAAGHIACVELLLGIAAEPDVPNEDGQTPFALASRGGHLAVTSLIRQYAPAAGTPSGGDAQFQALQLGSVKGGSATADALPRPHGSGSASTGPGTPDHRGRDLEHRCYSAAGLDQRRIETNAGREPPDSRQPTSKSDAAVVERGLFQGARGQHESGVYGHNGEQHLSATPRPAVSDEVSPCSPPLSSSAPVHGSLFDGLQVYVVGGRQPLGSQHASGVAAAGGLSARSARTTTTARTMVLDSHRLSMSLRQHQHQHQHQHQQREQSREYPQNGYHLSQQASLVSASTAFSSGALEPNWRDNVLSAPSTVAPSPPPQLHSNAGMLEGGCTALVSGVGPTGTPTASGGNNRHAGVPGSARALARMMHFSGGNNLAAPASADGLDSPGRGSATRGAVGSPLSAPASSDSNAPVEVGEAGVDDADDAGGAGGAGSGGTGTGGGGGDSGGHGISVDAIGSWMTCDDHDQDKPLSGSVTSTPKLGQYGDGDGTEPTPTPRGLVVAGGADSPAISGGWVSDDGTAERNGVAEERSALRENCFFVKPSAGYGEQQEEEAASVPLPGLWRVFESQGYPYYLHEASGYSQWEDPRENDSVRSQQLLSTVVATDRQDQVSDVCFEGGNGTVEKERDMEMAPKEAVETPKEMDRGYPPPASPIKPTGVPVAVDVSRYVSTAAVTRSAGNPADCGGEQASKPSRNAEQEDGGGEFFDTPLEENEHLGRTSSSTDSCGVTDTRDFGSVGTASFHGGNDSAGEDGASLLSINGEEGPVTPDDDDDDCGGKNETTSKSSDTDGRPGVGGNATGRASHRSADTATGWGAISEGGREDTAEGPRRTVRREVAPHDEPSIAACRSDLSVESSTLGTRNGCDDEQQEQKAEAEEEWWQELDDETSGETDL